MNDRIALALLPQHLDFIVRMLRRCAWEDVNPMLADIDAQVRAAQPAPLNPLPNGHAEPPPLEALP